MVVVIWFYFRKILHKNQYVGCKIILTDVWECNKIKWNMKYFSKPYEPYEPDKPSSLTSLSSIREKTGIWHVEIDKKICEKWYDEKFYKTRS